MIQFYHTRQELVCGVLHIPVGEWSYNIIVCCDTILPHETRVGLWCIAYTNHRAIKELVELPVGLLGECEGVYIILLTRMK